MTDQTAVPFGAARPQTSPPRKILVKRHSILVRVTHWVWVVSLAILLMSGLQIFNAHPSLNFGNTTTFASQGGGAHPLVLDIDNDDSTGVTTVLGHRFDTTGWLGVSRTQNGLAARAFPSWITLPADQDLATGRHWHFLFAWVLAINGLVYIAYGILSGHFWRDIVPKLRELPRIPHDIVQHLRLRFSHGPGAPQYNILQKLAYALILFVVLPVLVLAGLEMSPRIDAALPWLRDLFGGRQSARTIHFLMAWTLVAFVIVHVVMVVLSGLFNNLRSMITGRFAIKDEPMSVRLDRRAFVAGAAGLMLAGCDRIADTKTGRATPAANSDITYAASRALPPGQLAPEYDKSAISPFFKPNGSIDPKAPAYKKLVQEKFASWALEVGGLVDKPARFSLADLRALPARTQITRHDCVEGWSCIGEWTGVQLSTLLDRVGVKDEARFVVFHCFDNYDTDYTTEDVQQDNNLDGAPPRFYGSIGIADAAHPQTILAYDMNGAPLPVAHGAPVRLRVERQLGYKSTKYVDRIEVVSSFAHIGDGKGGYWEDSGYDWYAGI